MDPLHSASMTYSPHSRESGEPPFICTGMKICLMSLVLQRVPRMYPNPPLALMLLSFPANEGGWVSMHGQFGCAEISACQVCAENGTQNVSMGVKQLPSFLVHSTIACILDRRKFRCLRPGLQKAAVHSACCATKQTAGDPGVQKQYSGHFAESS